MLGAVVQVLWDADDIFLFALQKKAAKNPRSRLATGVSCTISFLVAQYGHRANNGFEPHAAVAGKGPNISRHMLS